MTVRGAARFLLPAFLAALLAGCATAPPARAAGAAAVWLGGTPNVVVRVDPAQVKAWGEVLGGRSDLKEVGARTSMVWAGLDVDSLGDLKNAGSRVKIVLEGDFPKTAGSLMLSFNGDWTKESTGAVWTNSRQGLSVSIPDEGLVTVRRQDRSVPAQTPGVLRDLDPAALGHAAVWVSFWDPAGALVGTAAEKLLEIRRLDLVLSVRGEVLEGPVILRFADERSAKGAGVLMKLFARQIREKVGQDLAWTVEGSTVKGSTFRVSQKDLTDLALKLLDGDNK